MCDLGSTSQMQQHETDLEERQLRKWASQKRGLARYLALRATEEMFGDPVFTTVEGDEVRQVVEFVLIDSCQWLCWKSINTSGWFGCHP